AFFSRFTTGEAVPYFYEPFLEAFDPTLRKELGVWYTPTEVVQAMVARVDNTLKQDLHIRDGLAAENVVVLDPCCGTGAYLAAVLRRIAANLEGQGLGALAGARVKAAATGRVFGFEIMPAPFVIAHLQVGLTLQELDAPLAETGNERAGVFLTNALTGWEPQVNKPLPFPELEEERDRAERVKQEQPILVILGNPPYNGFAGLAVDEERALSNAYRTTRRVRKPEGQGLNDLYVRFFRMAERRIAEKTGQGVICFISNYSWLDGLSFTGMRERFLEVFDAVRIDCLNGDVRKGGKTPDGEPDGSVFTVGGQSVGIQVGTAIATLVRKRNHKPVGAPLTCLRHLWGPAQAKREELLATAEMEPGKTYQEIKPILPLGLPFVQTAVSDNWFDWPSLPELFPKSFPGVKTSRDGFLVEVDLDRLRARVADYFNPALSHEDIARRYPGVMKKTARFDAHAVRDMLLKRGGPNEAGFVRFAYRPFDNRWLYWEAETKLLDEKRADYWPHVFKGNLWISSSKREIQSDFTHGLSVSHLAGWKLGFWGIHLFPARLREEGITNPNGQARRPNLSIAAQKYLTALGVSVEDLFYHVLAVLHDPAYREANAGALRMGWPRIPLPGWPKGDAEGAAVELARSAAHGRQLAALLDPDVPVPGVTQAPLRPEMKVVAVPSTTDRGNMANEDFAVTAGWGHFGKGDAVMPGQGRVVERPFTPEERSAMAPWHGTLAPLGPLGDTTLDVYLNDHAFWRNVPLPVWRYKLGGYQVLKKWLSYRERGVLGRELRAEEVLYFAEVGRRIGGILGLTLGANSELELG
ncbi:MAG: N-6 DNA methylase, partial [Cyanobacteria bacterium MAG IRC3_bin_20]|nr:N-6 DNA methylase [Cyanobacteria bacterium MAG IRC3_bin_20]